MRVFRWTANVREFLVATAGGSPRHVKAAVCSLLGYPDRERDWLFRTEDKGGSVCVTIITKGSEPAVPAYGAMREIMMPASFISRGCHYRIRLDWVAERSLPAGGGKRGKVERTFAREEAERTLAALLARNGVTIEHIAKSQLRSDIDPKKGVGKTPVLSFEAVASVSDVGAFTALLETGVGRMKSYGYGMIIPSAI